MPEPLFDVEAASRDPRDGAGWAVIAAGLTASREALGARLVSAYAIGSLAHGGFSPAVSDVDLALILDASDPEPEVECLRVQARVAAAIPTVLGQRLSLFWSSWADLNGRLNRGRLDLYHRLDLVHAGRCVWGADRRAEIWMPDAVVQHERLVTDASRFMLERWATPASCAQLQDVPGLVSDLRALTQAVLMPVRLLHTLETDLCSGVEPAVLLRVTRESVSSARLVHAAWLWRTVGGIPDKAAVSTVSQLSPPAVSQISPPGWVVWSSADRTSPALSFSFSR